MWRWLRRARTSTTDTENSTRGIRSDGQAASGPENYLGLPASQSGAGVLGTNFGYDPNTGMLSSLTTFQGSTTLTNGVLSGTGAAATSWAYDPATGQLAGKTYADGSQVQYKYNAQMQLKQLIEPGIGASSFNYDGAGELANFSLYDTTTGQVSNTTTPDELGRAALVSDLDNSVSSTERTDYWPAGQLKSQAYALSGGAGVVSVGSTYSDASDLSSYSSPGSLKTTQLNLPDGTSKALTTFNYDPSSKWLQTVSVNGVAVQYSYRGDGQLAGIQYGPADANGNLPQGGQVVTANFTPDGSDASRLGELKVISTQTDGALYDESVTGYFQTDQRQSETVTRQNPDGTTQTEALSYTYDPSQGDGLTSVTDNGNVRSFAYDGAGNYTGSNPTAASLGSPNAVNQYANDTYNGRGDVTSNGVYMFGWDALDRLISVTPKTHGIGSLSVKLGYDSQNRWLWRDVYVWTGSTWAYAYSRRAAWDGNNLAGEVDQNGKLVAAYTWGPNGLAAVTDYTPRLGPKTYVPVIDASGNTALLVDPLSGTVVASYQYDPYGTLLASSGPDAGLCPFLGKGLYAVSEVPGISLAGNRATDGKIWLSRDPSGEGSDPNLYQLDDGDPINEIDATGDAATTVAQQQAIIGQYATWNFRKTPSGFVAEQPGTGRQTFFTPQLDQIGYYSPQSRTWRLEARSDGSLWKMEKTWNSSTQAWNAPAWTQLLPSQQQAEATRRQAVDDAQNPAFALSDQLAANNGQNVATLLTVRGHILAAAKLGMSVVGATNPLVGGSEILTGRNLDGQPMDGSDYVQAGGSLIPAEVVFVVGGKLLKVATGKRARSVLREALGANPYPVAAQAHHLFPVELFDTPLGKKLASLGRGPQWGRKRRSASSGRLRKASCVPSRRADFREVS